MAKTCKEGYNIAGVYDGIRRGGLRLAPTGKMTISELGITYCDPPLHKSWIFQHLIVPANHPQQQAVAG